MDAAGQNEAARAAYLAVLAIAPEHGGALNHLGALLWRTGYRSAARTAFGRAALCCPDAPDAFVNLANLLREDGDQQAAEAHYRAALASAPSCAEAHQGLAYTLAETGHTTQAALHRRLGREGRPLSPWPYRGDGPALRVLVPFSVLGGNVPLRLMLDDPAFAVTALAAEFYCPGMGLPPHDVVLNAVGDADLCGEALEAVAALPALAPVLNAAAAVRATARVANTRRLGHGPGIRAPRLAMLPRAAITTDALRQRGFTLPCLLRSPGFHTGQHFLRVESPEHLADAVGALPGTDLLVIECLDARGMDGVGRKYRVMAIGRRLYPLHLALSPGWKIHYFAAAMASSAEFRAEEARFLADMPGTLGPRACGALHWVARHLKLDYAGIDFALAPDGTVLLFEANATMALVPPPPDPIWDYRRPAFAEALAAARALVLTVAGQTIHAAGLPGGVPHGLARIAHPRQSA